MKTVELVTTTSFGSLTLPKSIIEDLNVKEGTKFVVFNDGDAIFLKKVETPTLDDFEEMVDWGVKFAKEKGIKPEDVIEDD